MVPATGMPNRWLARTLLVAGLRTVGAAQGKIDKRASGCSVNTACRFGGDQGGDSNGVQYKGFDQLGLDQRRADFQDGFIREK